MEIRCRPAGGLKLLMENTRSTWVSMMKNLAGKNEFPPENERGLEKCDVTAGHLQRSKIGLVVPWIVES